MECCPKRVVAAAVAAFVALALPRRVRRKDRQLQEQEQVRQTIHQPLEQVRQTIQWRRGQARSNQRGRRQRQGQAPQRALLPRLERVLVLQIIPQPLGPQRVLQKVLQQARLLVQEHQTIHLPQQGRGRQAHQTATSMARQQPVPLHQSRNRQRRVLLQQERRN